jgi:hypothetical protein
LAAYARRWVPAIVAADIMAIEPKNSLAMVDTDLISIITALILKALGWAIIPPSFLVTDIPGSVIGGWAKLGKEAFLGWRAATGDNNNQDCHY